MEQLLIHIFSDYWLQSDWMALNKNKKTIPCLIHCIIYTLPFLILTHNVFALFLIFITHFIEDRWYFIKYIIWLKNHANPQFTYPKYSKCNITGFYDDWNAEQTDGRPKFITTWIYIICDNSYHLMCNFLILKYFTN
jgi:Protein of unknown function (DUF3307)